MALHIRGSGTRQKFPDYVVKRLVVDRIGVFSGLVVRHFEVGTVNQRINPRWLLEPPQPWDLPCVESSAEIEPPVCIVSYRYEGSSGDSSSATFAGGDPIIYELDDSMAEEPIETHPAFKQIAKLYGWDKNERRFAETLTEDPTGNAVNNAAYQAKKTKDNPLFGTESWLSVGVIFRKTYSAAEIPATLLDDIGTIVQAPQGSKQFKLPKGGKRRNWLKLAPKVTKRGNVVQIVEEWMLSGPRGWQSAIYSGGQLNGGTAFN